MITFRPMRPDEFAAYSAYFIPEFAADLAANFGLSPPEATAEATRDLAAHLPQGPQTPGQDLYCILGAAGGVVGYLWFERQAANTRAFLMDFHILPPFQGLGIAGQALAAWESALSDTGVRDVRLRVSPDNPRALRTYESAGFRVTGLAMAKPIGPSVRSAQPAPQVTDDPS